MQEMFSNPNIGYLLMAASTITIFHSSISHPSSRCTIRVQGKLWNIDLGLNPSASCTGRILGSALLHFVLCHSQRSQRKITQTLRPNCGNRRATISETLQDQFCHQRYITEKMTKFETSHVLTRLWRILYFCNKSIRKFISYIIK